VFGSLADSAAESKVREQVRTALTEIWAKTKGDPSKRLRELFKFFSSKGINLRNYADADVGSEDPAHTVIFDLVNALDTSDFVDAVRKEIKLVKEYRRARDYADSEEDKKKIIDKYGDLIRVYEDIASTPSGNLDTIFNKPIAWRPDSSRAGYYLMSTDGLFLNPGKAGMFSADKPDF
jgi:hypothetical protein